MDEINKSEPVTGSKVAKYFDNQGPRSRSILVPYAADVMIIARIDGAPRTAIYFTKETGTNVSEKQVKLLLRKVREKNIIVTREELIQAANSHPRAAQHLLRDPSLVDPQAKRITTLLPEPEENPTVQPIAKKSVVKKIAKKKAKEIAVAVPTEEAKEEKVELQSTEIDENARLLDEADAEDNELYN